MDEEREHRQQRDGRQRQGDPVPGLRAEQRPGGHLTDDGAGRHRGQEDAVADRSGAGIGRERHRHPSATPKNIGGTHHISSSALIRGCDSNRPLAASDSRISAAPRVSRAGRGSVPNRSSSAEHRNVHTVM